MLKVISDNLTKFINNYELKEIEKKALTKLDNLKNKDYLGNDFLGWLDYANNLDNDFINDIQNTAKEINKNSDYLLVIGIGGSYLGAKSMSEIFPNTSKTKIIYLGQNLSSGYVNKVIDQIKDKDFSINIISKSGTTLEPAIIFQIFKNLLKEKYPQDYNKRIYATTDKEKGLLKNNAIKYKYKSFIIPDNVGGRFSIITPVGLLPMSVHGIDIKEFIEGFKKAKIDFLENKENNQAIKYASLRNYFNTKKDKNIELTVSYDPSLKYLLEWWRQLFGESEGKENKGLFPSFSIFSTDLHSIGQYIQEGSKNILETVINIENYDNTVKITKIEDDENNLNYLENKDLEYINKIINKATIKAHTDGNVPNIVISLDKITTKNIAYLMYFYMITISVSGYLLEINPFDQPGVEEYKKNMFSLLK